MKDYADRLAAWAERAGASAECVRYARPAARGEVCAVRLAPAGEPRVRVVAVHGAGNDAVFPLLALFHALLDAGAEVFSFDVDGHGCHSTTVFSPDTVRTAVAAAADEAERGRPALPLHLLGHSLGGSLVLDALASGAVDRAHAAAVISAPTAIDLGVRTVIGELRGFFRRTTLAQRAHYGWWGLVPAFGPVKRRAYPFRREKDEGGAFGYVGSVRALLDEMALETRVRRITVPTLLAYSRADRLVEHAQGMRLARRTPGAEMLSIGRVSHYGVSFDETVVARVTAWLDAHAGVAA